MRAVAMLLGLGLLAACQDVDGDGVRAGLDCDDADPARSPQRVEVCNGIDDDCDGLVDEDVAIWAWQDRDRDGYGDPARGRRVCAMPADGVDNDLDCDDANPAVNPDGVEVCNEVDDNCDGTVDEGVQSTFYADADGDGRGAPGADTVQACVAPPGYGAVADDCDDTDPAAWTGRPEVCDGVDNNCDGVIDEGLEDRPLYADADGDGWGDAGVIVGGCGAGGLAGGVPEAGDCDDRDAARNPDAIEDRTNGIDDDCDGRIDERELPAGTAQADVEAALLAAAPGEVVQLDAGFWPFPLDLSGVAFRGVIAGEGCGRTVIGAGGVDAALRMDGGTVEDLTLTGGSQSGFVVDGIDAETVARRVCVEGNTSPGDGGGIKALGRLRLEDVRVVGNVARVDGGGIAVVLPGEVDGVRVDVRGNRADELGGGLAVSGTLTLTASTIAGNTAFAQGGGILVKKANNTELPVVSLEHVTAVDNRIVTRLSGEQGARQGSFGFFANDTTVSMSHVLIAHHPADHNLVTATTDATVSFAALGLWGNPDDELRWVTVSDGATRPALAWWGDDVSVRGPADFVAYDPSVDPSAWDLRLLPGSAFVAAGDASTTGAVEDIGATGGADADPSGAAARFDDADGDGLLDAWERANGHKVWTDDAASDLDGDGLDAAAEQSAGTDPRDPDSDGDGVSDGVELAAGADPRNPVDHDPVPIPTVASAWPVGEPLRLDGLWSFDPDRDALGVAWSVLPPPGGTAQPVAPSDLVTTLTADAAGVWTVILTLDDGRGAASASVDVEMVDAVIVPDEAVDLPEAVAQIGPGGGAVAMRAGTWTGGVDLSSAPWTLLGLAPRETVVVEGDGASSVVQAIGAGGHTLAVHGLTLRRGGGEDGGVIACDGIGTAFRRVVLRHAILEDGDVTRHGGLVFLDECALDARDSVLRDGVAGDDGGLIRGFSAAVVLRRVVLADGTAVGDGGLVDLRGGSRLDAASTVWQGGDAQKGALLWHGPLRRSGDLPGRIEQSVLLEATAGTDNRPVRVETGWLLARDLAWGPSDSALIAVTPPNGERTLLAQRFLGSGSVPGPSDALRWTDDGDATNDLWSWRPGSALAELGVRDRTDADGTRRGVGPAAGPHADPRTRLDAVDLDGDGLSDGWEQRFGLDRTVDDAALDPDGDGRSNAVEYAEGTDPTVADP